jgi:hypothetical protein
MTDARVTTLVEGTIALAIIAATTVLLALHDLSESTSLALYGVAITLVGGNVKALLALRVPAPAQPVAQQVPPQP